MYDVVLAHIEGINEEGDCSFADGRYVVAEIDEGAFLDTFFEDTDFLLPADSLNAMDSTEKHILGVGEGVFGVVNELPPAPDELAVVEEDAAEHVQRITEITPVIERELRRRHATARKAVEEEVAGFGVLYRKGKVFPYSLEWMD